MVLVFVRAGFPLLLLFFRIFLHIVVCLLFHMDYRSSLHSFREKMTFIWFGITLHLYIIREYWYIKDGFSCVRINRAFPFASGLFFFFDLQECCTVFQNSFSTFSVKYFIFISLYINNIISFKWSLSVFCKYTFS